ncbi:MAG: large conductance mechanosensitive channel protein MscL [Clostridia bacterium]|nr:large conductance mechanosensitive channel protein MscL [Clostridia bacterium]
MAKKGKVLGEFREFIMRGNVINLAVGVIIGGAFQKIVTSLVNDLIMPLVGLITGDVNFNDRFVILKMPEVLPEGVTAEMVETSLDTAKAAGATTLSYGAFITAVIDFLIMAVVIFLLVKFINKITSLAKKPEEPAPEPEPTTKTCPFCCTEIPIEAVRCPHCTSDLPVEEAVEDAAEPVAE